MPTATHNEANPEVYEDDGEVPELELVAGDYATRMEEILGRSDDEDEENFLYDGQDSQEASATYNEQLQDILEGSEDQSDPDPVDVEEERQVEQELEEKDAFIHAKAPRVRPGQSFVLDKSM